jgi:hypothetical protein
MIETKQKKYRDSKMSPKEYRSKRKSNQEQLTVRRKE